ncbi:hypothetical protein [Solirubrum puertoriconensis]|uniref:Lipoprotein n=1 Tax=Solirubrum puertoriconensis TaxID=1751427 RepID=A0A9X0L5W6_SOLP1|nr:hypothetical protein [Solirubrum puertoriconensis]KUG09125.1 hypothetical protein ASU33_20115 [Solirubrum puertoriconensis]
MKSLVLFLLTSLLLLASACNEDSYLEGFGPATPTGGTGGPTGPSVGRITLYCTNTKLDYCGNLTVYVDNNYKGEIADRATNTPACGANGNRVLTLELPVGSHSFSISSTTSNCLRYTFTASVSKNSCSLKEMQ